MDNDAVTAQIMEAWDEVQAEEETPAEEPTEAAVVTEEEPEEHDQEETPEVAEEEEPGEDEDEEEADEEEAEPEEEPEPEPDPEIQAFLAKYDGDVDKALRGAAELQRVLGRQGSEKAALAEQVNELTAELQRMQAFSGLDQQHVTAEQQEWIEQAVQSPNPGAYVNGAIQSGEFELARVLCREWAREDPFSAMRAAQFVDQTEQQMTPSADAPFEGPIDTGVLLNVLSENYPDMRSYEEQMVNTLAKLGPGHPLVQDAQSGELERSARGILGIYEIARASSVATRSARETVKKKQRQAGDDARAAAVVSSSTTSPSATEKPRPVKLGPGLTLEDLEAEFARQ